MQSDSKLMGQTLRGRTAHKTYIYWIGMYGRNECMVMYVCFEAHIHDVTHKKKNIVYLQNYRNVLFYSNI